MFPARVWLLSISVSTVLAEIQDDVQVILSSDEPLELPDLVQTGIWLEENRPESSGPYCCSLLNETLLGHVFFPDSTEYQSQQASYYSLEQSDINPACRVSPTSAVNIATIVALATQYGCAFAVRSGGHMISKGFSNVDPSGFTIDLQKMNQVSVLEEGRLVSFDSGCRWHQVYSALKPYNLTTVGGRVPDVGVSGFLLGGGISVLSLAHGFGSSNIVNYQVVLADGTINDVNENHLPDLYWALKYGSTNFGIVTRFDMTTYPLADVWGGSLIFDISKGPALLQAHVDFTAKLAADPMGLNVIAFAWDPRQQTYIVWSPNIYLSDTAFPPLYSDIEALVPNALLNTMRITDLMSITNEFQATAPGTGRVQWFTLTLKADAALLWDIHCKGVEIFEPYLNRTGFSPATIFQPLNRGFAAAGEKNGGNPSGISTEDGDLIVALGMVLWDDRADDEILKEKVHEHWRWSERTARERGLLHPFIYMNYASSLQDVMGSLGVENQAKMRKIKYQYDPEDRFARYWKGGFKL
ncbi:hypothetical protein C8F04DRAFT_110770 [Mycena alexandri]|uniref:FAD-binding PCMH-type domain-containing protein n=1 Tax=Mycena alexandri TaxID=1745969 RepID=A0AAD6X9R7_9AGAR|nr:hypothetical protein C8F04DRAFT_110770 [Mycena alexandri]